jgi:hypothetical protein
MRRKILVCITFSSGNGKNVFQIYAMKFFTSLLLLSAMVTAHAQDLKPLDYASLYAKHKITSRECVELRYAGNTVSDTIKYGDAEFDAAGRMIRYTEYFSRGRKMAEYIYEYDATGKMVRNTVSLVFNDWTPLEMILTHDDKGRVIARELPEALPNFWRKETYSYKDGVLIRSEQWFDVNDELKPLTHHDYPASLKPADNSLTYIHDQKGLLILHQFYGKTGGMDKALSYTYR